MTTPEESQKTSANQTPNYVGDITGNGAVEIKPFRICAPDGLDPKVKTELKKDPAVELVDNLSKAQAAIIRSATKFPNDKDLAEKFSDDPGAHNLDDLDDLSLIVRMGDGHDNINKEKACNNGVSTINTPGVSSKDVTLQTLAFVLSWGRHIVKGNRSTKSHLWEKKKLKPLEMNDMTLGIIGKGSIGTPVGEMVGQFFKKVQYYDVDPTKSDTEDLAELLKTSDVVTIHVNVGTEVLTPDMFECMGNVQLLVNTSRGKNVNGPKLIERLNAGDGFVYASDVHNPEPPFPNEEKETPGDPIATAIIDHPDTITTPHIAASRVGNQRELSRVAIERVFAYATNGTINPINVDGHTYQRVEMNERDVPGIRAIVFHENIPEQIATISAILDKHNIRDAINGSSRIGNCAVTQWDFESNIHPELAEAIINEIKDAIHVYNARLLFYANPE